MDTNNSNNSPFLDDNSPNSSNFDFVPPNDQVEENIAILYDMGFKLSMINKVYLLLKLTKYARKSSYSYYLPSFLN